MLIFNKKSKVSSGSGGSWLPFCYFFQYCRVTEQRDDFDDDDERI